MNITQTGRRTGCGAGNQLYLYGNQPRVGCLVIMPAIIKQMLYKQRRLRATRDTFQLVAAGSELGLAYLQMCQSGLLIYCMMHMHTGLQEGRKHYNCQATMQHVYKPQTLFNFEYKYGCGAMWLSTADRQHTCDLHNPLLSQVDLVTQHLVYHV